MFHPFSVACAQCSPSDLVSCRWRPSLLCTKSSQEKTSALNFQNGSCNSRSQHVKKIKCQRNEFGSVSFVVVIVVCC